MARPKKEIKKTVYVKCRIEPELKDRHIKLCESKGITPTIHLRDFIIKELEKHETNK